MSVSSDSDSDDPIGSLFRPDEDDITTTFDYTFALPPVLNNSTSSNNDWSKAHVSLEGLEQEYGQVSERTGFTIWDAASVLANYMVRVPSTTDANDGGLQHFQGKRVIELGTGLGLCGILATHLKPARVVLTDGDDRVLKKTNKNCERNNVEMSCQVKKLRWGKAAVEEFLAQDLIELKEERKQKRNTKQETKELNENEIEEMIGFDTVFGSDIIYDANKLEILFATVSKLLANSRGNGIFIVAYRRRSVSIDLILNTANTCGFDVAEVGDQGELYLFTPRNEETKDEGESENVQKSQNTSKQNTSKSTSINTTASNFFIENASAVSNLSSIQPLLISFIQHHSKTNRPVAIITSGGTTVPLELKTVRFIDNFSTGTRGARCCEELLRAGYAVIFLHRRGSAFPFVIDMCTALRENPTSFLNGSNAISIDPEIQALTKECLFSVPFTTLFEYMFLFRDTHTALNKVGSHGMTILAAAVSDFYIPVPLMAEDKIQSRAATSSNATPPTNATTLTNTNTNETGLTLNLTNTPKMLGFIRTEWCPQATIVSFKLETNTNILVAKAAGSLQKYGVDIVCANVLGTHRSQVRLIQQNGTNEIVVHGNGAITGNETKPIEVEGVIDTQVVIQGGTQGERQWIEIPLIQKLIELHSKNIKVI